jgi:hypothetical protein
MTIVEPTADAFFATATGVCVYVNVGRRAIRVQFESPDSPAVAEGLGDPATKLALAVAIKAFQKHHQQLRPLFDHVATELAERRGTIDVQSTVETDAGAGANARPPRSRSGTMLAVSAPVTLKRADSS